MAYKDKNGNITIDENAANADIHRSEQAVAILQDAQNALRNLITQAGSFQGDTAAAILEKATEMNARIQHMIDNLEDTQSYTRKVVAHYKELDLKLKEMMESQ